MFPEYREAIHRLKQTDAHFRRLFDEHNVLDAEIEELEHSGLYRDEKLIELKLKKLLLKDALFSYLQDDYRRSLTSR